MVPIPPSKILIRLLDDMFGSNERVDGVGVLFSEKSTSGRSGLSPSNLNSFAAAGKVRQ